MSPDQLEQHFNLCIMKCIPVNFKVLSTNYPKITLTIKAEHPVTENQEDSSSDLKIHTEICFPFNSSLVE